MTSILHSSNAKFTAGEPTTPISTAAYQASVELRTKYYRHTVLVCLEAAQLVNPPSSSKA